MVFKLILILISAVPFVQSSFAKDATCDWVIESLYQRKNLYASRVNSSQTIADCYRFVDEEESEPFPIPDGCRHENFSKLVSEFKNSFISFDGSNDKVVKVGNSEKVIKFIEKIRNNIHLMLKAKCDSKAKVK